MNERTVKFISPNGIAGISIDYEKTKGTVTYDSPPNAKILKPNKIIFLENLPYSIIVRALFLKRPWQITIQLHTKLNSDSSKQIKSEPQEISSDQFDLPNVNIGSPDELQVVCEWSLS